MTFGIDGKDSPAVVKKNRCRMTQVLAFFPVDNHLAEGFVIEVDDRNPEIGFAGLYLRRERSGIKPTGG